jgi:hypothetical protein
VVAWLVEDKDDTEEVEKEKKAGNPKHENKSNPAPHQVIMKRLVPARQAVTNHPHRSRKSQSDIYKQL